MSLYEKYKTTGRILEPVIEEPEKESFLKKAARVVLPKSLEYKFGITPKPEEVKPVELPKFESLYDKYKKTIMPEEKGITPIKVATFPKYVSLEEKATGLQYSYPFGKYAFEKGLAEIKRKPKEELLLKAAPPEVPEKDTLFKKVLRFILPKSLELKFKLRKPTTEEEIWEKGKDVEEYYGRGEDLVGGIKTFGQGLLKLPKATAVAILQSTQGHEGASIVDKDWADRYIEDAKLDLNMFVSETAEKYKSKTLISGLPIKITDFAELPQNLAFSIASMGAGLGVGVPIGLVPLPGFRVAAWTLGTAASGKVAYEMTSYEIMQQYLELKNEEKVAKTGEGITLEEEKQLKNEFSYQAMKYGLWEAIPEAISNLGFVAILTAPLQKIVGKSMAANILTKMTALYGEELLTETITQKGQSDIEVEANLREGKIGWIEAFKEIAPQTFLLTTVMAGAGTTIIKTSEAVKKINGSLKNEIGEKHPLYEELEERIIKESKKEPRVEIPPVEAKPVITTKPIKPSDLVIKKQTPGMVKPEVELAPEGVKPLVKPEVEAKPEAIPAITKEAETKIEKQVDEIVDIVLGRAPEAKPAEVKKEVEGIIKPEVSPEALKLAPEAIKEAIPAEKGVIPTKQLPGESDRDWVNRNAELLAKTQRIPTEKVYIESLKEKITLEEPIIEAVKATQKENPVSSGFHESLNKKWTIVYKGKVSGEIVNAAEKAGLKVSYRQTPKGTGQILTDVYSVDIKPNEIEKATEVFDKFANFYIQALKGVKEVKPEIVKPVVKPEIPTGKVAGVAKSIEAKAIEQGLTNKGFDKLAEYNPVVIKEQSQMMSDIMSKDIERAKRIAIGKETLPEKLKGATALSAMEDYAMETKDGQLALDLANSPIATEISVAGQTLRLTAERTPDSATAKIKEIAKEREKVAEKKLKGKTTAKAKSEIKDSLNKKMEKEKSKISKYNWESFIDSITC